MPAKLELYRWEDDPDGELAVSLLQERGLSFSDTILDPEIPEATPSAIVDGKMISIEQLLGKLHERQL